MVVSVTWPPRASGLPGAGVCAFTKVPVPRTVTVKPREASSAFAASVDTCRTSGTFDPFTSAIEA
jgi:hypothetical protein